MRLIDADKLKRIYAQSPLAPLPSFVTGSEIDNAPTVKAIPLDKPFCKMVYGDYVVYNKKWLVNHLQTEWNILQGKEYKPAIPVEWFKSKIDAILDSYPDGNEETEILCKLLYEWEKENDKGSE